MLKYYSTKKFGPITTGHRQWKDSGHCKYVHGYARYVEITFACDNLDDKQWVMDFGGLKDIKNWLNEQWDHRLLIASDDPLISDFKSLHDKGGCNLNIMDIETYGAKRWRNFKSKLKTDSERWTGIQELDITEAYGRW